MTVTKRKQPTRDAAAEATTTAPPLESGVQASCDSCADDVTHNVHVRCAESFKSGGGTGAAEVGGEGVVLERLTCPDFDLCVPVSDLHAY